MGQRSHDTGVVESQHGPVERHLTSTAHAGEGPRRRSPLRFGVATSAYQTEGGLSSNNWAAWERARPALGPGHKCGSASRSWEHFEDDLENLRWLGVDLYRFSIEWSRVEPAPGRFDDAALERYRSWCVKLDAAGITPMVTLHHFTEPLWVTRKGGFEGRAVIDDWLRFVAEVLDVLGDVVHTWITVNEPVGYVVQGWVRGEWPPGKRDPRTAVRVLDNLLTAHADAYRLIHADAQARGSGSACTVGLAHHIVMFRPRRPRHLLDRAIARSVDRAYNRATLEALHTGWLTLRLPGLHYQAERPGLVGTQDFMGLNHYYPLVVGMRWRGSGPLPWVDVLPAGPDQERDDLGLLLDAGSLVEAVGVVSRYGLPVFVTEHGVCDGEEPDRRRICHLEASLAGLLALPSHCDVIGYVHWSLVDNWEWTFGHAACFGLFAVDRCTGRRTPKPSADTYRRLIGTHRDGSS